MNDFKDKVSVVTGAGSGIGRGLAERCAAEGMKVVLAGINESTLRQTDERIRPTGAATLIARTDVSKADDVQALAQKTIETFGAVHLLFNNAGVGENSTVVESTLADWRWILGVNLWGSIHGMHFFVPLMMRQRCDCHVVNIASIDGVVPSGGPYGVSKHGIVALSEGLHMYLGQVGSRVRVSVVLAGAVKTNIVDAERNRPADLMNDPSKTPKPSPDAQAFTKRMRLLVENGMSPGQVADIVFDGIRQEKFYIYTHPEMLKPMLQAYMETILEERDPGRVTPA